MAIIAYEVLGKNECGLGDAICKYVKSIVLLNALWTFERKEALEFNDVNERLAVIDFIRDISAIVADMSRLITG